MRFLLKFPSSSQAAIQEDDKDAELLDVPAPSPVAAAAAPVPAKKKTKRQPSAELSAEAPVKKRAKKETAPAPAPVPVPVPRASLSAPYEWPVPAGTVFIGLHPLLGLRSLWVHGAYEFRLLVEAHQYCLARDPALVEAYEAGLRRLSAVAKRQDNEDDLKAFVREDYASDTEFFTAMGHVLQRLFHIVELDDSMSDDAGAFAPVPPPQELVSLPRVEPDTLLLKLVRNVVDQGKRFPDKIQRTGGETFHAMDKEPPAQQTVARFLQVHAQVVPDPKITRTRLAAYIATWAFLFAPA